MAWQPYNLDQIAHDLVFNRKDFKAKDENVLNQVYKMRATVAYGLERFWGEKLRLEGKESEYWEATWEQLVNIMKLADIKVPNSSDPDQQIHELWLNSKEKRDDRKVTLAVLNQLCDCMIWWTQRYK